MLYFFSREIPKKGYINQYGNLGVRLHKEAILVQSDTQEGAFDKVKPFNKGKHIKFRLEGKSDWVSDFGFKSSDGIELERILDLGEVLDYE